MNDEDTERPRRMPSTIGGVCYLVMLLLTLGGIALTVFVEWRLGVRFVGGSLLGLAALRLVMPAQQAGMLAVRSRAVDVALLVALGVLLIVLAGSIPDQPPLLLNRDF